MPSTVQYRGGPSGLIQYGTGSGSSSSTPQDTDGHKAYLSAVEDAFGCDVDYAMLVKLYGATFEGETRYSPAVCTGTKATVITGHPDNVWGIEEIVALLDS